ncbi:MAG: hypothetical protein HY901_06755 [Deltaproteobacteria bacterium]|nr:hypothetical protein [Deltaproteobacteria bacterium]
MSEVAAGAAIAQALDEAARALEADDALAAQVAMARVREACREVERGKAQLPPVTLKALQEVYARCVAAAARLSGSIGEELQQMGTSRKAADAYRGQNGR